MGKTPTLQSLALYARDHFGEDGYPFEESIPSSLDVVAAAYAHETDRGNVSARSRASLREHLQSRGRTAAQVSIDEFVQAAITYLRAVYPDAEIMRNEHERRMLSHLFWGHLVEARFALGGLDLELRSAPAPTGRPTPR